MKISLEKWVDLYLQYVADIKKIGLVKAVEQAEAEYLQLMSEDKELDLSGGTEFLCEKYVGRLLYMEDIRKKGSINRDWEIKETKALQKIWDTHNFLYKILKAQGKHANKIGERPKLIL